MISRRHLPKLRAILGLILLGLMVIYVGGSDLLTHWGTLKPIWLTATALCIVAATLLGGLNINLLLHGHQSISLRTLLPAYWAAWAIGLIVPGQIGDMAALSTWLRRHGLEWHIGLGCSLLDKFISLAVLGAFGLWGLIMVIGSQGLALQALPWIIIALLVLALVLRSRRQALWTWLQESQGLLPQTLHTLLVTATRHPWRLLINFSLTLVKASLIGLSYWCMFVALGQAWIDPTAVIALAAASSLVAYIPVSFNGLGTVELTGIALFGTLGLSEPLVLSAYLALRMIGLILAWSPVLCWLGFGRQMTNKSLSQSQRQARDGG